MSEATDGNMLTEVRKVASDLQTALERFSIDSKLVDLAQHQVPDARHRLAHVLRLTSEAAHRTMDLVEQCCPLADRTAREAERLIELHKAAGQEQCSAPMAEFLQHTAENMGAVRGNLAEVLLAQGYQDLSGQIIRSVMTLVDELELALRELLRITQAEEPRPASAAPRRDRMGPVVPGIVNGSAVSGQQDVDALLSDLGM
jgi:chemotaxis protein CheZ